MARIACHKENNTTPVEDKLGIKHGQLINDWVQHGAYYLLQVSILVDKAYHYANDCLQLACDIELISNAAETVD